jgi:hypothetical protein
MTACKYWDCGWCYAPNYLKTNAINSTCVDPNKCPISPLSEPVKYEKPMTAVEDIEAQIKVLQSKLEFYKELEKTKSPVEEAYNEWYGEYPPFSPDADRRVIARWHGFQAGYNASKKEKVSESFQAGYQFALAQKDYKVGEYQETVEEPEEQVSFVPKEIKELVKEGVKWCEEHPDKDPLDCLKPQHPEQVADGLKEAFREAVKQGVVSSHNKPKTLSDLIYDWWGEVFTSHSDLDMETSIENLVDEISLWLPTEHCTNNYKWNQCIRTIREKLR